MKQIKIKYVVIECRDSEGDIYTTFNTIGQALRYVAKWSEKEGSVYIVLDNEDFSNNSYKGRTLIASFKFQTNN